jgi:hypothetical protein
MGRLPSANDAFADVIGTRRGSGRSEEEVPTPDIFAVPVAGGFAGGVPVRLEDVKSGYAINAIKALRAATKGELAWAKRQVYDRVAAGECLIVSVINEDAVADLRAGGWAATLVEPDGFTTVIVQIPAQHLPALKAFADEHAGNIRGKTRV